MAEFIDLVRTKKRICKMYSVEGCIGCPLLCNKGTDLCGIISISGYVDSEFEKVENVLKSWAVENPEPVYPTWAEWLDALEVVVNGANAVMMKPKMLDPIPADIAQKLGLELKEG